MQKKKKKKKKKDLFLLNILHRYGVKVNNAILAEEKHKPVYVPFTPNLNPNTVFFFFFFFFLPNSKIIKK